MYTFSPTKDSQGNSVQSNKRSFKFQRKNDYKDARNAHQVKVASAQKPVLDDCKFQIEWPNELLPIMSKVEAEERQNKAEMVKQGLLSFNEFQQSTFASKAQNKNQFFSICDKVKAYILAQNFVQIIEKYMEATNKQTNNSCSSGMFHRALNEWQSSKLFSFKDSLSVTTNKDLNEQIKKINVAFGTTEEDFQSQVQLKAKSDLLSLVDSKERVEQCWRALSDKVANQLAVFDSNHFCKNLKLDPVTNNQIIIRFDSNTDKFLCQQIGKAIKSIVNAIQFKFSQTGNEKSFSNCIILTVLHFQAFATGLKSNSELIPTRVSTHSIDFRKLFYTYITLFSSSDKKIALQRFLQTLGLDPNLSFEGSTSGSYTQLKLSKIQVQFFQVPSFYRKQNDSVPVLERRMMFQEPDLMYDARMMIYAISRARVQYLSSCVPLFRFKHCLFEALISSIHEGELRPAQPENDGQTYSTAHKLSRETSEDKNANQNFFINSNEVLQNPIIHERFLLRKFLEFMSHPPLKVLLLHSIKGETLQFVECFNRLTDNECPQYSKFKISLYDINQRKYIIQAHTQLLEENEAAYSQQSQEGGIGEATGIQPWVGTLKSGQAISQQLKEVYMVHYNGFVFGANFARMLIIRERETKMDSQSDEYSSIGSQQSSFSDQSAELKQDKIDEFAEVVKVEEDLPLISSDQMNDPANKRAVFEKLNFFNATSESESQDAHIAEQPMAVDLLEIKSGFNLSAQLLGQKQKKFAYREKRKIKGEVETFKNLVGLMAIKVQFAMEKQIADGEPMGVPQRLICYGSLPLRNTQLLKIFEGPTCHVKFLLWALQNVTDYSVDNRIDQTLLNIFTIGGSSKELPLLLRGLVQIAGKDVYFFGDINRVKYLKHENINFYDMCNFFENANIPVLAQSWLRANKKEVLRANAPGDKQIRDVLLTYELSSKFLKEVQSIQFKDKKLDFNIYSNSTGPSLSLAIYQYFYLDKNCNIKGTLEEDILAKERLSIKSPYITIKENNFKLQDLDMTKFIYRLYKMNRLMTHLHVEQPIPFNIKQFQEVRFSFNSSKSQSVQHISHKPLQFYSVKVLKNGATDKDNRSNTKVPDEFKFFYSSLYKVEFLRFKPKKEHVWANLWRIHRDAHDSLEQNQQGTVISKQYIWGVELIYGLLSHSIDRLKVTEEITYFQSKLFHQFAQDMCEKRQKTQDRCQQDIIEMVMDNFSMRFGQKCFDLQQIQHVNDLQLVTRNGKQFSANFQNGAQFQPKKLTRILDFGYPYYYVELKQKSSDKLQQIGSLCRITGFLNAVARVKTLQSFEEVCPNNILYLDNQYLLLKNASLTQKSSFTNGMHAFNLTELGKWQLVLETQIQTSQVNQSMLNQLKDILAKPLNFSIDEIKNENLDMSFKRFQSFFSEQEETILFQKYLTFLANKSYFQKSEAPTKLFKYEFDSQVEPTLDELESLFFVQEHEKAKFEGVDSVISIEGEKSEQSDQFITEILTTNQHAQKTIQMLQKAVKTFEAQYASGQMEAVVFSNQHMQQEDESATFAAAKAHDDMVALVFGKSLPNPAYPASHPANSLGNLSEYGLVSNMKDLQKLPKPALNLMQTEKKPSKTEWQRRMLNQNSPTALSSRSSNSFTSEMIQQKFGLDANDPMFAENKGSLISAFFSQAQRK